MTITEILPWILGNVKTHHAKGELSHLKTNTSKCTVYVDGVSSPDLNYVTLHRQRTVYSVLFKLKTPQCQVLQCLSEFCHLRQQSLSRLAGGLIILL